MVEDIIYLDNHSASRPCSPSLEQTFAAMQNHWRFALPKHPMEEADALETRYPMIYDLVGAHPDDSFVFTSSGAEAINQVHWTAFLEIARKEGKCHFVTCAVEDAPLLQSLKRLEDLGCYVKIAPLDKSGRIDLEKLIELISPRTAMISISMVHGLTGVVQPIEEISCIAHEKGILLHVDATYALGKCYCNFQDLGVDYLTFSGDRLHSVKSSGGLFAKAKRPLLPFVLGAPLDVPAVIALAAAASHASLSLDLMGLEIARLRDRLEEEVLGRMVDVKPLFKGQFRLPNVSVLSFPRVHQEALFDALRRKRLFASIGGFSMPHLSRHLIASGFDEHTAETAISFSLSRFTTLSEIEKAIEVICEAVSSLRTLTEDLF